MRKLLSGLVLFFISCATFADSAWNVAGAPTPVASHTDLSIAYLAQVFGTVGTSLQGTSGQMLGILFSKLNEGILVVAGIWLIYTIITIVLRSAMDGSFMGPNKNVFWIIIRIALAFAMLIPGPMTGYNIIQDIVMKVVVEGVSLADQTWNVGLGYIAAGGSLWHRPESTGMDKLSSTAAKSILTPGKQIFLDEVCMVKSSSVNQNPSTDQRSSNSIANTSAAKTIQYNVVTNDNTSTFYFPGVGNGENYSSNLSSATVKTAATCGSVAWSTIPGANCSSANSASCLIAKAAVSQMVYDMLPAAQEYVRNNPNDDILNDNSQAFFNSFVNYINAVMPIAQSQTEGAARKAKRFIPDAMSEGWMMAGRYYWDLSQVQANYSSVSNIVSYVPAVVGTQAQTNTTVTATVSAAGTQAALYESNPNYNPSQPISTSNQAGALQLLQNYNQASGAGDTGPGTIPGGWSAGSNWLMTFLTPVIGGIVGLFALFSTHASSIGSMGTDPILFLHNVGMKCIQIAGSIWFELALTIFGLSSMTIVCQSTLNLDTPLRAITTWLRPPLMMLAGALLAVGVLLGYYIPLYPFMLFTFGVIGWIICVIEAMVAAPLIAFGLTHPEGHDFLGEAKQGLMLLLGVFLRPVLMIIGLIAGMILSYVSLRILVYTYSGFLQDIFWTVTPIGGASGSILHSAGIATGNVVAGSGGGFLGASGILMALFTFPLMLGVFAALVYVVTTQCFSLIYVLPDYILRWIGGPQANPGGVGAAQMAQQIQGSMSGMARTTGEVVNTGIKAKDAQKKEDKAATTEHDTRG